MTNIQYLHASNLNLLGIRDLRKLAFSIGVYGYTKYNKEKLIDHILAVINGKEPPKTQISKGRPCSITQTRKQVFNDIVNKLKYVGNVQFAEQGLDMVASHTKEYDTERNNFGSIGNEIITPKKQIIFKNKELLPINIYTPIAFGSRAIICGSYMAINSAFNIFNKFNDYEDIIFILPEEAPEEILQIQSKYKNVFYTTSGDTKDQTKIMAKNAFAKATQLAQDGKSPIIIISSIIKLAKSFNANSIAGYSYDLNIFDEYLAELRKLCLSAHATEKNNITLIAFAPINSTAEQNIAELLKPVFSIEIVLDEKISLINSVFPIDIQKSYSKHYANYQEKHYAKKQTELREKLLNGEIDNKQAITFN